MVTSEFEDEDDKPPVLKTWGRLYIAVLLLHLVILTLCYLLMITFS